jgi:hypothetical protein
MYARSTTIRNVRDMDAGIAHMRDSVMPAVQGMSGCVGLSLLCDRDGNRCIATTAWADEGSMRATEEMIREIRQGAVDAFGGDGEVQEWEIAIMHRVHEAPEGACTRVTWAKVDPAAAQQMTESFRMAIIPRLDDLPGFCSTSVMVDRASGRCALAATYESRAAMERANDTVAQMREKFTQEMGMDVTDMAAFDLVLAHLRVPETV